MPGSFLEDLKKKEEKNSQRPTGLGYTISWWWVACPTTEPLVFLLDSKLCLISLFWAMLQLLGFCFSRKTVILHLTKGPVQGHITEDRKRKKPRTQRESNPLPLCYKAHALPLCYNRAASLRF